MGKLIVRLLEASVAPYFFVELPCILRFFFAVAKFRLIDILSLL